MCKEIGIYGGTFSPPHKGHINAALEFTKQVPMQKLFIIPANIPPHKEYLALATTKQRLEMCRIAFQDIPNSEISEIEINREGKSYTYETILELKKSYDKIHMLIGTDMFFTLSSWVHPEIIFENADIYCFRREETISHLEFEKKNEEYKKLYGKEVIILSGEIKEISSSQIREDIRFGGDCFHLTEEVTSYIRKENLYKSTPDFDSIRLHLSKMVDKERYVHSLGVEKMAAYLAQKLLPNEENDLRVAAIFHDITKCYSKEEHIRSLREHGIEKKEEENLAPQVLHGWTAPLFMQDHFKDYYSEKIAHAIHSHTTGEVGMSLFDEILFLADFIEENRTYDNCIQTRNKVLELCQNGITKEDMDKIVFSVLDMTILHLKQKNIYIANDTVSTWKWLKTKETKDGKRI